MLMCILTSFLTVVINLFLIWIHLRLVKANYYLKNGYIFCEVVTDNHLTFYGYVLRSDYTSYEALPHTSTWVFPIYNSRKVLITSSQIVSLTKVNTISTMIFKGGNYLWRTST